MGPAFQRGRDAVAPARTTITVIAIRLIVDAVKCDDRDCALRGTALQIGCRQAVGVRHSRTQSRDRSDCGDAIGECAGQPGRHARTAGETGDIHPLRIDAGGLYELLDRVPEELHVIGWVCGHLRVANERYARNIPEEPGARQRWNRAVWIGEQESVTIRLSAESGMLGLGASVAAAAV